LELRTDASNAGVGGVLLNRVDGQERVVAYISQAFNETQSRWDTREQEAYGVFFCVTSLRHFLLGHHFVIKTDHRNLTFMERSMVGKVTRWRLRLQEYTYDVEHIAGKENSVADALSRVHFVRVERLPTPRVAMAHGAGSKRPMAEMHDPSSSEPESDEDGCVEWDSSSSDSYDYPVARHDPPSDGGGAAAGPSSAGGQRKPYVPLHLIARSEGGRASDARAAAVTRSTAKPRVQFEGKPGDTSSDPNAGAGGSGPEPQPQPKPLPALLGHAKPRTLNCDDVAALKKDQLGADLGISDEFISWFFANHNGIRGHAGVETTFTRMVSETIIDGKKQFHPCLDGLDNGQIRRMIKALRRVCPVCQKIDGRTAEYVLQIHVTIADAPWEVVQADWSGPYPKDKYGNRYTCQMRCVHISFSELQAYDSPSAENTARMLLFIVGRYALPRKFMTDQGTHFTAEVIRLLLAMLSIDPMFAVPHRPQAIGSTERMHGELSRYLKGIVADKHCAHIWSDMMPLVQRAINSDDIATGVPSQSLLYGTQGRLPSNPLEWLRPCDETKDVTLPVYLQQVLAGQESIRATHAAMLQERVQRSVERNAPPPESFEYDVGMRVLTDLPGTHVNKFTPKWRGPFVVIEKLPGEAYRIGNVVPNVEPNIDVHIEHLRPFFESMRISDIYDPAHVADMDVAEECPLDAILDWVVKPMAQKNANGKYTVNTKFYAKGGNAETYLVFQHMMFLCQWTGFPDPADRTWEPFRNIWKSVAWKSFMASQPHLGSVFSAMSELQLAQSESWSDALHPSSKTLLELSNPPAPLWSKAKGHMQCAIAEFKPNGLHSFLTHDGEFSLTAPTTDVDWCQVFCAKFKTPRYAKQRAEVQKQAKQAKLKK
jgi:transposase InsO family protein